jgi:hypothetical protein
MRPLRCRQSHIVELKEAVLDLQPNAQGFIQLRVLPQPRPFDGEVRACRVVRWQPPATPDPRSLQALVFINDDGDATEEVLALKVSVT